MEDVVHGEKLVRAFSEGSGRGGVGGRAGSVGKLFGYPNSGNIWSRNAGTFKVTGSTIDGLELLPFLFLISN